MTQITPKPAYLYKAFVAKVVDGDTVDLVVDLGFTVSCKQRFRLARINAPEMTDSREEIRALAMAAKTALIEILSLDQFVAMGQKVIIKSEKPLAEDKYGRWIAEIYLPNGLSVSDALLERSLVKLYPEKY